MKLPPAIDHPIRHHQMINARLKRRLVLYPVVAFGMFVFVVYDSITGSLSPLWILMGSLLGLGVGYVVSLMYKIYWQEDKHTIVSGIDRLTVFLIILYVILRFLSEQLAGQFIHGTELTVITFSFLAGLLTGRMFGVLRKVNRVLERQMSLDSIKEAPKKPSA